MPSFTVSVFPPNGLDRADGSQSDGFGPIGTPTPDDARIITQADDSGPDAYFFEELPDSPEIERGEQGMIRHRFLADSATAQMIIKGSPRGLFLTDTDGNTTRVVTSRFIYQRGDHVTLEIAAESISFDTPPDEFRVEVVEQLIALEKHPRYAFLTAKQRNTIDGLVQTKNIFSVKDYEQAVAQFPVGDQRNAANELLHKRKIGEDTFQMPGFRITWVQYFWKPVLLNPGGYIEDPIRHGGLPEYFWNIRWPDAVTSVDNDNIFSACKRINPQLFALGGDDDASNPDGISWLRQCDVPEHNRTWFKVTHSWIGAPYAHWDAQVYSPFASPYPRPPPFPTS